MNLTEAISFALKYYYEEGISFFLKLLPSYPAGYLDLFLFCMTLVISHSFGRLYYINFCCCYSLSFIHQNLAAKFWRPTQWYFCLKAQLSDCSFTKRTCMDSGKLSLLIRCFFY